MSRKYTELSTIINSKILKSMPTSLIAKNKMWIPPWGNFAKWDWVDIFVHLYRVPWVDSLLCTAVCEEIMLRISNQILLPVLNLLQVFNQIMQATNVQFKICNKNFIFITYLERILSSNHKWKRPVQYHFSSTNVFL